MRHLLFSKIHTTVVSTIIASSLASCAISPETQAKMDEYTRTIPTCSSDSDCAVKWAAARAWVVVNSDFIIQGDSDTRLFASNTLPSQSGIGAIVDRVATGAGNYQIVVDLECFSVYSCPGLWDSKIDFNRTVNNAR